VNISGDDKAYTLSCNSLWSKDDTDQEQDRQANEDEPHLMTAWSGTLIVFCLGSSVVTRILASNRPNGAVGRTKTFTR